MSADVPLFPQAFIDEVRMRADIVAVVQETVALRRAGATMKGLCPFHGEKTPSFQVSPDKGLFYCFGCGVGGDVFKFVELRDRVGFADAVRLLAQRFGIPIPELERSSNPEADAERETLLRIHEAAAAWFREQLAGPGGARARAYLADRGLTAETVERLGLGLAPASREALKKALLDRGFTIAHLLRSGLVVQRENGQIVDRFRNRLMIPICRESGSVVAFGGRALDEDQMPKYLNSPETPIYVKGRTLYGLHLTRQAVRRLGYAVIVEGYFDLAQAVQAGIQPVVASCGTALTTAQAQVLRRHAAKVVLSFDPDAAGRGAATRSCELLVSEGFQVNVAVLPTGADPDAFIRRHGGAAYAEQLRGSRPYLEYLLDQAAGEHDLAAPAGRRAFLERMLAVAARIPDAAARDQFADRVAHRARISEDVVRAEIRKAAVARRTTVDFRELPGLGQQLKPAERDLLVWLMREPAEGLAALEALDEADLDGLSAAPIFRLALELGRGEGLVPTDLLGRLGQGDARIVSALAAQPAPPAPAMECARALRRLRFERERAAVQQQIDGLTGAGRDEELLRLCQRKKELLHEIEALSS